MPLEMPRFDLLEAKHGYHVNQEFVPNSKPSPMIP
jgi:hypothetical protein